MAEKGDSLRERKDEFGIGVWNMVIQNCIFPDEVCKEQEMYFRICGSYQFFSVFYELSEGTTLRTDTYMNMLDIGYLKKYTNIKDIILEVSFCGSCQLNLWNETDKVHSSLLYTGMFYRQREGKIQIKIPKEVNNGICYLEIVAKKSLLFYGAKYTTVEDEDYRDVRLAVDIVTYHREEQITKNLSYIANSLFYKKDSELYGKMKVFVVDNGNSLADDMSQDLIKVYRNSNRGGGSGGFTRGLEEIKRNQGDFRPTHIVFMDDDVQFQIESLYRLYSFLAMLKDDYMNIAVAGRMFRMDDKNVQYTSVEKWNHGKIRHVNGNLNMCWKENILKKEETGDYGGWWFCTYPAEHALRNRPFPFYLHCDDVEYGLRFSGKIIALKGVQVWHETFEYRQKSEIVYYDIRNAMVVNAMQGDMENQEEFIGEWKNRLTKYHNSGNYAMKYLCTLAMHHFRTGKIFWHRYGKLSGMHLWLKDRKRILKFISPIFHRYEQYKVEKQYMKIKMQYEELEEKSLWL